jgi:hypothetical protein
MPYVPRLVRLSFTSRPTFFQSHEPLRAIHAQSDRKNQRSRVTGALVFDGASFLEVLEGDRTVIRDRVATIFRDSRHTDIAGTVEGDVSVRLFGKWTLKTLDGRGPHRLDRARLVGMVIGERAAFAQGLLAA